MYGYYSNSSKGTSRPYTDALGDQISNREVRQRQISFGVSIMLCDTLVDSDLVELLNVALGCCSCKIDCSGKFHMTFVTLNIVPCELSEDCPSD